MFACCIHNIIVILKLTSELSSLPVHVRRVGGGPGARAGLVMKIESQ